MKKVPRQPVRTKRPVQTAKRVANTAPANAVMASNYIRQYGDPRYVPSNGIGVGGNKNGEPKAVPKKLPLKKIIPAKKPYTPSNGGYSNFA